MSAGFLFLCQQFSPLVLFFYPSSGGSGAGEGDHLSLSEHLILPSDHRISIVIPDQSTLPHRLLFIVLLVCTYSVSIYILFDPTRAFWKAQHHAVERAEIQCLLFCNDVAHQPWRDLLLMTLKSDSPVKLYLINNIQVYKK